MNRRDWAASIAVATLIVVSLGSAASPAGQPGALTLVAGIDITDATHMEFLTRQVAGPDGPVEHTFVLLGSREAQPAAGATSDGGLHVIDVTDPEHPVRAAFVPCATGDNDIAVVRTEHVVGGIAYDAFIALSSNNGGGCPTAGKPRGAVKIVGVRAEPLPGEVVSLTDFGGSTVKADGSRFVWEGQAAHTIVAHPTEPLIYVASQRLAERTPSIEIIDLAVWQPRVLSVDLPPTGISPHDVTFRPDGLRASASSINLSFVWDTSDPRNPVSIGEFASANLKVHHESVLHPDGRHLFVVDEFVNTTSGGVGQCPGGGVHVFDLGPNQEFETAPVPVGQFYALDASTPATYEAADAEIDIGCTAHEFNFGPEGRWMPIGWTGAGTRIFDLSTVLLAADQPGPVPVAPVETAFFTQPGTDVYAAKVHPNTPGYVFVSDTQPARNADGTPVGGFRVLRYAGASR